MSDNMHDPNQPSHHTGQPHQTGQPGSNNSNDPNKPPEQKSKIRVPKLDTDMKNNLIRALYMILFLIIGYIAAFIILIITIVQFVYTIIFKAPNTQIKDFSGKFNTYFFNLIQFLTYHTDVKPFPFTPWPKD